MASPAAPESLPSWPPASKPVQLVAFAEEPAGGSGGTQLVIPEAGQKALQRAISGRRVKPVAVCGLYRTGKSLLLNLLAGTQGGFAVGSSVRACTEGVWAWPSQPDADGNVVLLLDFEGLGNTERDRAHDARLFALAVLISSLLVFNSKGVITEKAVQTLAMAAGLADHIHRQHQDTASGNNLSPEFLWVLRDFALALEDAAGNPITEAQYLDQVLRRASAGKQSVQTVNGGTEDLRDAREKILDLFPNRDCLTLVIPVDDETQLQRLGDMQLAEMRPKFAAKAKELRSHVLSSCKALKSSSGEPATGDAFLALVAANVKAMNTGALPQLDSVWQQISESECARAVSEGEIAFEAGVRDIKVRLPVEEDALQKAIDIAAASARSKFADIVLGEDAQRAASQDELERSLSDRIERLLQDNARIGTSANEVWLLRKWENSFLEPLEKWRRRQDSAEKLSEAECDEAESFFKSLVTECEAAYRAEGTGDDAAREGPWQQIVVRRMQAVYAEIKTWRQAARASALTKTSAENAERDERAKLQQEGESLRDKVRAEVEESRARVAALQAEAAAREKAKGEANRGEQADLPNVQLDEKSNEATDTTDTKPAAKKCCSVQ